MHHNPHLNKKKHPIAEGKFQTCVHGVSCAARSFGQLTVGHTLRSRELCDMQQISRPRWATYVSKSHPTQMETRNSNSPLATKSVDDTSGHALHISAGTVAFGRLTGPERLHWMKMSTPGPTRLPDNDNDDIASFTSLQTTAIDTPSL